MPTVVVLDTSLSMSLPVSVADSTETFTSLQLAVHGINSLLDYLALYSKLEFVALVSVAKPVSCLVIDRYLYFGPITQKQCLFVLFKIDLSQYST